VRYEKCQFSGFPTQTLTPTFLRLKPPRGAPARCIVYTVFVIRLYRHSVVARSVLRGDMNVRRMLFVALTESIIQYAAKERLIFVQSILCGVYVI